MSDTQELIEALKGKARECRAQARKFYAAAAALTEPQKPQGRPVNPKRELLEAIRASGLSYKQIAARVGVSYRYVSWVARGQMERPELEQRIREVLTSVAAPK